MKRTISKVIKEKVMDKSTIFRHGEVMLVSVNKIPKGKVTKAKEYILAHSETGHHHVLEAERAFEMTETDKHELYLRLFEPAQLIHKKAVDKHRTITIPAGYYQRFEDTEYSPFDGLIRRVRD